MCSNRLLIARNKGRTIVAIWNELNRFKKLRTRLWFEMRLEKEEKNNIVKEKGNFIFRFVFQQQINSFYVAKEKKTDESNSKIGN